MSEPVIPPVETSESAPAAGDSAAPPPGRPWGFWATLGFGILIFGSFLVVQAAIAIPFSIWMMSENPGLAPEDLGKQLERSGLFLAVATLVTGIICPILIAGCAWLRRGISVGDYLPLRKASSRSLIGWLLVTVCMLAASDGITHLLGRDIVPEVMIDLFSKAVFPPLLWIALVVGAPLFEEFFFRGFLYAGWSQSKLGVPGTIVLTSLIWASIHMQYDLYQVGLIFVLGIFLGLARHRTGSLVVPILIHATINLIASIETMLVMGR